MNKLDFYKISVRLHLVKLVDQNKDVRQLIKETANTGTISISELLNNREIENIDITNPGAKFLDNLKKTIKENKAKATDEEIQKQINVIVSKYKINRKYGQILEDQ